MGTCQICGMRYIEGLPDDEKQHRGYHDKVVNGVPARRLNADQVIWANHEDRIEVVNSLSPAAQRKRAALTSKIASREMRYAFSNLFLG